MALAELMQKMSGGGDYADTKNFWCKKGGEVIRNPVEYLVEDLDSIPFPDYSFEDHYIPDEGMNRLIRMDLSLVEKQAHREVDLGGRIGYGTSFSRGCQYHFTFCHTFKGIYREKKYVRIRSIQNLIAELEAAKERFNFIGAIVLFDYNLFFQPLHIIREFSERCREKINLPRAPLFTVGAFSMVCYHQVHP